MKAFPETPRLSRLFELPAEAQSRVIAGAQQMQDGSYCHWEKLRHLPAPSGLSSLEWWLALKLKRSFAQVKYPELRAIDGTVAAVTRHASVDAALARMDRLLAGTIEMPDAARNPATRDRFIASSLMEEAIHSSLFEGAVSTRAVAKDMLRSERPPINRDERMILNNYRAMLRIRETAQKPMTVARLLELHSILVDGTLDDPTHAGRFQTGGERRIQVVDDRLNRVVHTPPPASQIEERMQNLIDFANGEDIDEDRFVHPVVRAILLHFQLAYDHPFYDGNGRTARALFYWSMLHRGYWMVEFISISRLLHASRRPYEMAYLQVESDEQDATYFVLQQLDVLESAVRQLFAYVERKNEAQRRLRAVLGKRDDLNHRQLALLDHALRHPEAEYTHESHANSHRVSIITARSDLLGLVRHGWLDQRRRSKRFVYTPIATLERALGHGVDAH